MRKAFLADTEDWRSNAMVGDASSPIAQMNIIDPDECTYLEDAAGRKMSFSRQKSLSRAISYRQTLIKRNGELADSQYTDQYLDKETITATLKRQQSKKSSTIAANDDAMDALGRYCTLCSSDWSLTRLLTDSSSLLAKSRQFLMLSLLNRSLGHQPNRVLASFVSRSARPASAPAHQAKQLNVEDKGMARAISRIMTRTRTVKLSVCGATTTPGEDDEYAFPDLRLQLSVLLWWILTKNGNCSESMEECPRMEDI